MNVTTNNHRRELLTWWDLTITESEEFDYITEDEQSSRRFVRAYGSVHDVGDVQRIVVSPTFLPFGFNVAADSELASWHGIATESAFSATVFRWTTDASGDDAVVVGWAYSS